MEIERITSQDPGKLLYAAALNAEHLTPELQHEIAAFMRIWSKPQISIVPAIPPIVASGRFDDIKPRDRMGGL